MLRNLGRIALFYRMRIIHKREKELVIHSIGGVGGAGGKRF